jgi:alkylation response protein AidB-like acyl-CoA dehydrogenase
MAYRGRSCSGRIDVTLEEVQAPGPVHDGALARARAIADHILFPTALEVERRDVVPTDRFDVLADAGLYGIAGPPALGGVTSPQVAGAVIEALAGGCLATTFVWMQHHGAVRAVAACDDAAVPERWLRPLCAGDVRAGIVFAGLIPGPPRLTATPTDGAWRLDGTADWVSGWGLVDVLLVIARGPGDTVISLLVDAGPLPGLGVERLRLTAIDASATVRLTFDGVVAPRARTVASAPFDPAAGSTAAALRGNGSLALGVAGRACRLLEDDGLTAQLGVRRSRLDAADDDAIAAARADASAFAVRAASALLVASGSRAILPDAHAQRLAREALVLLVFGSRPGIKAALAERLAADHG